MLPYRRNRSRAIEVKTNRTGRVPFAFSFSHSLPPCLSAPGWFIQHTSTSFRVGRKRIIVSFQTDSQTRYAFERAFFGVRSIKYSTCDGAVCRSERCRLSKEYYRHERRRVSEGGREGRDGTPEERTRNFLDFREEARTRSYCFIKQKHDTTRLDRVEYNCLYSIKRLSRRKKMLGSIAHRSYITDVYIDILQAIMQTK